MRSNGGAPNGNVLGDAKGLSLVNAIVDAAGMMVVVTEVVGVPETGTGRPHAASPAATSTIIPEMRISLVILRQRRRVRMDGSSSPMRATACGTAERTRQEARQLARSPPSRCASTADRAT